MVNFLVLIHAYYNTVKEFHGTLYTSTKRKTETTCRKIRNLGSEEIPEIEISEITILVLSNKSESGTRRRAYY